MPATFLLAAVGGYAIYYSIQNTGGWDSFVQIANDAAAYAGDNGQTVAGGISLVIGAWIAGAVCSTEVTRFSKTKAVAAGMVVIALPICQVFLNILGYVGQL